MPLKTQASQAPTVQTEATDSGSSSLSINRKRQLFEETSASQGSSSSPDQIVKQDGKFYKPKNMLVMQPREIRSLTWPEIFLSGEETYVSLKANFYVVTDSRNRKRFIDRHSKPHSEVVYFKSQAQGETIVFCSVERYLDAKRHELWFHLNLCQFNKETKEIQSQQIYQKGWSLVSGQMRNLHFKGLQLIDNFKKVFLIMEPLSTEKNKLILYLFDFHYKKPKYLQSESQDEQEYSETTPYSSTQSRHASGPSEKEVAKTTMECKDSQQFCSLINSEYGDMVLLVTSSEIYEIEVGSPKKQYSQEQYSLTLKPFLIDKMLRDNKNTYLQPSSAVNREESTNSLELLQQRAQIREQQKIVSARYGVSGLKIILLTNHGRVFVLESQQYLMSESLYEILWSREMLQKYHVEHFVFKNFYPLNGMMIVEVEADRSTDCNLLKKVSHSESILEKLDERIEVEQVSRALLVLKMQSNSLSFSKMIPLPFGLNTHSHLKVYPLFEVDEVILETIADKSPSTLEMTKCQILSNRNSFTAFKTEHLIREDESQFGQPWEMREVLSRQKNYEELASRGSKGGRAKGPIRVALASSLKICYLLQQNHVRAFRFIDNELLASTPQGVVETLELGFFEKPIKLIASPLTGNVVIMFREFIKFYQNTYNKLKQILTLSIRNAQDICFERGGNNIWVALSDNTVHVLDAYTLRQTKVLDYNVDIQGIEVINQNTFALLNARRELVVFTRIREESQALQESPDRRHSKHQPQSGDLQKGASMGKREESTNPNRNFGDLYERAYEVKLDSENDSYVLTEWGIVTVRTDGNIDVYSHEAEERVVKNPTDEREELKFKLLSESRHPNLTNSKSIANLLEAGETPSCAYLCEQLGTLFIGTNSGNIKQMIFPFVSIEDPTPLQAYSAPVTNRAVSKIWLNHTYRGLYAMSESGELLEVEFTQYLNGSKKSSIYTISKSQSNPSVVKFEFANRTYLMDDFTTLDEKTQNVVDEEHEEACFVDDKIKDDIEDVINKIKHHMEEDLKSTSVETRSLKDRFKSDFERITNGLKRQEVHKNEQIAGLMLQNQSIKQEMHSQYEKRLLEVYAENDRLHSVLNSLNHEFEREKEELIRDFSSAVLEKQVAGSKEISQIERNYEQIQEKYRTFSKVSRAESESNQEELKELRMVEMERVEKELSAEESNKEYVLSCIGKMEKEMERYKKRAIYFENLIVETRLQIDELQVDVEEYRRKKQHLGQELEEKEKTIEEKQTQIVSYLCNNNEMKKKKNIHEFELSEYEEEIVPIEGKITDVEKQVMRMNGQIMSEFDSKLRQEELIASTTARIQLLKRRSTKATSDLLKSKNILLRFTESLTRLIEDPFSDKVKRGLYQIMDTYSIDSQKFMPDEDLEAIKKDNERLMRKKTILRKGIEYQERAEEGILRNKYQFFKYYVDNTNLVREFNQLTKDNKSLVEEKQKLQRRLNHLKQNLFKTPLKKSASLHIRKISEKKLTPFQRYEQQHNYECSANEQIKSKDTTETRISRGQSTSFLKSLIKDVSSTENNMEKVVLVRDRIRTFVNPEISNNRKSAAQRPLFKDSRPRVNTNVLKL